MHAGLEQELKTYEKRTPRSKDAHKRAESRLPLGVASNYRAYDPYPFSCVMEKAATFTILTATSTSTSICASAH